MRLRRPFYYSQSELSDQIGNIADLMKLREKSLDMTTSNRTTGLHSRYLKELDQFDTNIMVANEVLGIMLERNVKGKK